MKSKILFLSLLSTNAIASIDLGTILNDHYGQANRAIAISCTSNVVIQNNENKDMRYLVATKVCDQNRVCQENKGNVILHPGKRFQNSYQTVLNTVFNRPGKKDITCMNYVAGDEGRTEVKHGFAYIS